MTSNTMDEEQALAIRCAVPGCTGTAVYDGLCPRCDAVNPYEDGPAPEVCRHCGKELEDFSDLGCGYCDRRHPDWGIMP